MTLLPIDGLKRAVVEALERVATCEAANIYAISFYVYDEEDDPRRPTLTVGYNTVQQWQQSVPQTSSSDEAKWNYAFWLQNDLLHFGGAGSPGAQGIHDWVSQLGLAYSDADEEEDFDRCLELGHKITAMFVDAVCDVAFAVHRDGTVMRVFGPQVPIIIHELEYYDAIADQTERSNPPGVASEFVAWVRNV